ncbi:uncharacterized protein LOC116708056 [Xiphophorus hellerii]|uniref:uncharacterized protein LOC116708056 n=1 Tax=Xiphophorus hellerii TaxID=8084 RepID=UPI0013B3F7DC|nr:uncharacterized protein LOC116708056 [Xiphophorus hellerii]
MSSKLSSPTAETQTVSERSDFKEPADGSTCEQKKSEGLMGKIRTFFRNVTGKRSSKVAPLIVQEQPETSLNEKMEIQVEDVDDLSDATGCVAEAQPAKDDNKPTTTAAVVPLNDQGTTDPHREEPEVDLISPAEPIDPLDDADVENSVPEIQSTEDPQEQEGRSEMDEVSSTDALSDPEILLTENLLQNNSEPESTSDDSSDDSSSAFTPSVIEWDSRTLPSLVLDDDGNEEFTGSHVCYEEEREEMNSHLPGFTAQHFICEGMIPGELDQHEPETETTSESEEDQESEDVERTKTALRSLVRDVITMIIDKSGQVDYPPEEHKAICKRLFDKLWAETQHTDQNMSPDTIRRQGKPIFEDLLKGCSKPEMILLLLQAGTPILERNVLTTMKNRLQPRWKMISAIKNAFIEAVENLRENQHRLYIWL